ncbi:hypothetical protein BLNAU_16755 [Blattamonas nauphoetae]|uniref:Uncharacterized protein n=1 Tax=Blattamonas nauphoetae TaxID=2049346 RepID=A0ABQ9X817_9EUKA|nr:hypothetical protein BLNAU_16755 [Blattamonas nauphoetae]
MKCSKHHRNLTTQTRRNSSGRPAEEGIQVQTIPSLTQRRQRMLLVSVQIITHSLHNSLAAFLMLFNEAFHVTSFNLAESTTNGDNTDCRQTRPSSEPKLERHLQRARSEAAKTRKSSGLLNISAIEGILILGLLFIPLDLPTTLPVTDYAPLPPMSISFGMSKEQAFPESANEATAPPVVDADHLDTVDADHLDTVDADLRSHGNSDLPPQRPQDSHRPHTFEMQLVKNSGIFHAWWVGQDETTKTQLQIRKGWDGECEGAVNIVLLET